MQGSVGIDFARQVADRDAASKPTKKFRSFAPKGSKLATGYHDRTKDRPGEEHDDKAKRVKALEETMKLGQIDRETFEKLRDEIVGGDISSTHLIKGLDRRLLERVRRGDDVSKPGSGAVSEDGPTGSVPSDVDDELGRLEDWEVAPVIKEKAVKRGEMAPPSVTGVKRNRNAILAELKASRKAISQAKEAARPSLGPKFRRIGDRSAEPRIERDENGREVLITVDEDGNVKRKVRKAKAVTAEGLGATESISAPIVNSNPLGMEVPELPQKPAEEDNDDDIFEGIGADYNPLAGLGDDDEDESGTDEKSSPQDTAKQSLGISTKQEETLKSEGKSVASIEQPNGPSQPRNYFSDPTNHTGPEQSLNPMKDPTILTALKKVQKMKPAEDESGDGDASHDAGSPDGEEQDAEREARLRRRAAMLAASDRDLEDLDMGFGSSRFGDAEEAEEGGKIKLAEWKGAAGNGDEVSGDEGRGGKKRKRGPKKKKGDKNSAADVMKVIESRKK